MNNFDSKFLNTDFDKILTDQNNNLVNSNEHYLIFKNRYLKSTQENLENYTNLNNKYTSLSNNEYTTETGKVKYYIVNKEELYQIKHEINKILISQRQLFENFINHINFLNNSKEKLKSNDKNPSVSNTKKFLSKLKFN